MSAQSLKSETSDQAGLYLLLAELLHLEINPRLKQLLLQPDVLAVFQQLDDSCEDYLSCEWDESNYEEAEVAFCSQFILSDSKSVPRAAAWLEETHTKVLEDIVFEFII